MAAPATMMISLVLLFGFGFGFIHAVGGGVSSSAAPAPAPERGLLFHVGGPRGWRLPDANTSYGWWAMNNRFHVGDSLYFKYGRGDSVLVVDREAFDECNATEPVAAFANGATTVRLDRPGFFCFISGAPGHCDEGQRLVVRVMVHPAETSDSAASPAPATSQPGGHGGGGGSGTSGFGARSGTHGAASSSTAAVVAAGGVAHAAAAMGALVVMMLQ